MSDHQPPPPLIVSEKRLPVTVRAFRHPAHTSNTGRPWWEYDVWIVDQSRWTGRLPRAQAEAVIMAEGMTSNATARQLDRARKKATAAYNRMKAR